MGTYAHTFRRKTLMVKQMLRKYLNPQIYIHSHRHILGQKHICVWTHTLPLKTGFLIPQFLQVSYDLIYFRTHTVIYCYKFSPNHAAQKKTHIYVVTWFNKGATAMQQIKDDFFFINVAGSTAYPYGEKNETWPLLYAHIKIDSRWITELNMKHKIIKLLQDNKQKNIFMTQGQRFLNWTQKY